MPVVLSATMAEIEEASAHSGGLHIGQKGLVGEESLTNFDCSIWYAARVGDVVKDQYKILGKVAHGGSSTIWLAEDLKTKAIDVLKISINYSDDYFREERAFQLIGDHEEATKHPGFQCIQRPLGTFIITSERSGRHQCFLTTPSACQVEEAWRILGDFPLSLTKEVLQNTLKALDFLHSEIRLVHTDVKLDNILFGFKDQRIVQAYIEELRHNPAQAKIHRGKDGAEYPVTAAKPFILHKDSFANPKLNDLGESVQLPPKKGGFHKPHVCSPKAFRTPETILGRPFNETIDCWMVGCITLQLLTGKVPIKPHGPNQPWTEAYTLAQHHALLGPPPKRFIKQSVSALEYWNEDGEWVHKQHAVPTISLESMLAVVEDPKERKRALHFVKCCLQWLPKDRLSAKKLAKHAFLVGSRKERLGRSFETLIQKVMRGTEG